MKKLASTHDILLHLLDELPDEKAAELRKGLQSHFKDLQQVSNSYEAIAAKIRTKASLRKRGIVKKSFAFTGREINVND